MPSVAVVCAFLIFLGETLVPVRAGQPGKGADTAALDALLVGTRGGQDEITIDDMRFRPEVLRAMRARLAAGEGGPAPDAASQTTVTFWPGGTVYYNFAANVSALHQQAFLDAAAEWTAWARLTFTPASGQANYVTVNDGGTSLSGGNSYVGVKGGQQLLNIGSTSWNRGTLCHEIGHALGLIHEHQRFDRDTYVTILTQNATDGGANFVKLTNSANKGAYDFYSVMHYARNAFSVNPTPANPALPDTASDTIEPTTAYSQFLNVMGREYDRTLSKLDRSGIASIYGAPTVAPSATVTNTKDGGPGSLRTAIYYAFDRSTDITPSSLGVIFNIPTTDPNYSGGVFTIRPTSQLTAPGDGTGIVGASQTTFTGDTNPTGPEIFLNGTGILASESLYACGIRLRAARCVVTDVAVGNFNQQGILITGSAATQNKVWSCYIGTNATGTAAAPNAYAGVEINGGAVSNLIGLDVPGYRNVISGNMAQGVYIHDAATQYNQVSGSYIGLNAAGTAALPNAFAGIEIGLGTHNILIGKADYRNTAQNVISGNLAQGIYVHDAGTNANLIRANYIGLNGAGTAAVPNGFSGVEVGPGAQGNQIGSPTFGNVISGNKYQGVYLHGSGTSANTIQSNYIGTDPAGTGVIPNGFADAANHVFAAGVELYAGPSGNTVGGADAGARNVIAGNAGGGVVISGTGSVNNTVAGNYVGLNAAGTAALANGAADPANFYNYAGVAIFGGAASNVIGGATAGAGNVVSGNAGTGVLISEPGSDNNRVLGNRIGLDAAGVARVANGQAGVSIGGARGNVVGGTLPGQGNVISGNGQQGVTLNDGGLGETSGNLVQGNLIGLDATGLNQVANARSGVDIFGGATQNRSEIPRPAGETSSPATAPTAWRSVMIATPTSSWATPLG